MGIMKSVPTWFRARVAGKRPIWAALAFSTPLDVWAFAALLKAGGSEWMEAAPRRIHDAQQEAWAWGERTRWRDVDGFALVGALVDAQAIRTGLVSARCVCEGLTGALADQARRAPEVLYWLRLLLISETRNGADSLALLHSAFWLLMIQPGLQAEIARRQDAHIGSHAGLIRLLMHMKAAGVPPDLADEKLNDEIAIVRRIVWSKLSTGIRAAVEGDGDRSERERHRTSTLDAFVLDTIMKEYGVDGLEARARSLNGELNIAPRAIANDIADEQKREWREWRPMASPDVEDLAFLYEGASAPSAEEDLRASDKRAIYKALSPLEREVFDLCERCDDDEIAQRLGLKAGTIRGLKARIRKKLKVFLIDM